MNLNTIGKYLKMLSEFHRINKSAYKNSRNINILRRNSELRDRYNGKRIVLIFTGSSVNNISFKLLNNEYVLGCNFSVLHKDFENLNINFYLELETWSYRLYAFFRWLLEIVYNKTKPGTKVFLHASSYDLVKTIFGFRKKDTYYIGSNSRFNDVSNVYAKIEEMTNIITGGCFSASIAIAIYMGFKTIYLIGADYAKDPMISGHFYDGVKSLTKPSPELIKDHEIINEFAKSRGADIYNIVDKGFTSRTFKQINTEEFIKIIG